MALASPLPPWLNIGPQTYLGAMDAGGRLGIGARAQDVKQEIAADRLSMAYDALASKEQMATDTLNNKLQLGQMQQEYKQSVLDQRNLSQQASLEERRRHDAETEAASKENARLRLMSIKNAEKHLALGGRTGATSPQTKLLNELFEAQKDQSPEGKYRVSALTKALQESLTRYDPALRAEISEISKGLQEAQRLLTFAQDPRLKRQAQNDYQRLQNRLAQIVDPTNFLPALPITGTNTPPAALSPAAPVPATGTNAPAPFLGSNPPFSTAIQFGGSNVPDLKSVTNLFPQLRLP